MGSRKSLAFHFKEKSSVLQCISRLP